MLGGGWKKIDRPLVCAKEIKKNKLRLQYCFLPLIFWGYWERGPQGRGVVNQTEEKHGSRRARVLLVCRHVKCLARGKGGEGGYLSFVSAASPPCTVILHPFTDTFWQRTFCRRVCTRAGHRARCSWDSFLILWFCRGFSSRTIQALFTHAYRELPTTDRASFRVRLARRFVCARKNEPSPAKDRKKSVPQDWTV